MAERHEVQLTARDQLTPVLKNVGREAETAGKKAEDAGRRATRSTQDWEKAGKALGAGLGLLTVAAVKLGNESEVVQQRLKASIENTGHAYDEYADAIDAASKKALQLAFDDEDAADAIAQLTDATGDASRAISDLAIAQDIARGRGIDLAAATNIVIAAETGRLESLKRMGIEIDASATKEEALALLTAKYSGQAEAYAETNAATWDRVGNTIENKLEGIGGALADFQGPILALSTAGVALGPVSDALEALEVRAKATSLAMSALNSAWIGPLGVVVAAGAAAFAIYDFVEAQRDIKLTTDEATDSIDGFVASIAEIGTGVSAGTREALTDQVEFYRDLADVIHTAQAEIDKVHREGVPAGTFDLDTQTLEEAEAATAAYTAAIEANILTEDQWNKVLSDTQAILNYDNPLNAGIVHQRMDELNEDMANGTITASDYAWQVGWLTDHMVTYGLTLDDIRAGETDLQKVQQRGAEQDAYWAEQRKRARELEADQIKRQNEVEERLFQEKNERRGKEQDAYLEEQRAIEAQVAVLLEAEQAFNAVDRGAQGATGSLGDVTGAIGPNIAALKAMDDQLDDLAASLTDVGAEGLDRTFQMIVGFTSGMVNSIGTARDWADALIAPVGTYSELDNLLASGRISLDEYNEAQQAQIDITDAYSRAQTASNQIQAQNADLIADQADATADYIEKIAGLPEQEQLLKLAWANQDISGRANDIAGMAAGFDDMSQAQQDAFAEMVTSAAAADPALAAVLESLGLITATTEDPTGWKISMGTSDAESDIDRLNETMQDFILLLDPTYITKLDTEDMGAVKRAGIKLELFDYENSTHTTSLDADATGFWQAVNAIPTDVGDRYIDVYYRQGGTVGGDVGFALGGMVGYDTAALGRASGGALTLVGEHGPELVNLPGGSLVTPNHATMYRDEAKRGGMSFAGATFNFYGVQNPQQFMQQMRDYSTSMERR